MRARPDIRPHLLAQRMSYWLQIARCPIMNTRVPTWKARRNYRALVRKYPEIASALAYTEALWIPSPLHDLTPMPVAPDSEPAARTPAHASSAMAGGVPRAMLFADEVV